MYNTGETEKAVRLFLGLLRGRSPFPLSYELTVQGIDTVQQDEAKVDKVYLEDFRDALQVFLLLCLHVLKLAYNASL